AAARTAESRNTCCRPGGHGRFAGERCCAPRVETTAHPRAAMITIRERSIVRPVRAPYVRMKQTRRDFLTTSAFGAIGALAAGRGTSAAADPVIDIHQHLGYSGRSDDALLRHQTTMGITTTILLPAGRPVNTAST